MDRRLEAPASPLADQIALIRVGSDRDHFPTLPSSLAVHAVCARIVQTCVGTCDSVASEPDFPLQSEVVTILPCDHPYSVSSKIKLLASGISVAQSNR